MSLKSPDAPLKIAYVTRGRADDYSNWSGIVRHIRDGLTSAGHQVHTVDGIPTHIPFLSKIWARYVRTFYRGAYAYDRDEGWLSLFARTVERRFATLTIDCIVCPLLPTAAKLRVKAPLIVWDDGPFHALRQIYPQYQHLAKPCLVSGDRLDTEAISKSRMLAFASKWAAADAIDYHRADSQKVVIVPFGANAEPPFNNEQQVIENQKLKSDDRVSLLFVGIDWERKGGPLALNVHQELINRGMRSELTIIGCNPFVGSPPSGVECLGKLDKGDSSQAAIWRESFMKAHFFLMPTRAECFGVVYAEAAAHGLPSLATRVGGVPDAVQHGRSGWLLELDSDAREYAQIIEQNWKQPDVLTRNAVEAYRVFREQLNWKSAIQKFEAAIRERLY